MQGRRHVCRLEAAPLAAWTEPDLMRRLYATVVDADVRVGGRYQIELDGGVNAFSGEYLTLEPGERVAFTLTHHAQTPADRISDETVTVTFRETAPGRTEVTIVNSWTGPAVGPSDYETLRGVGLNGSTCCRSSSRSALNNSALLRDGQSCSAPS